MHNDNNKRCKTAISNICKWKLNQTLSRGTRVVSLNLGKGAHGGFRDGTNKIPEILDDMLTSLEITWCALQELKVPPKTSVQSNNLTYFLTSKKNNPIRGVGFAVNSCYVKSTTVCKQKELSSSHNTL